MRSVEEILAEAELYWFAIIGPSRLLASEEWISMGDRLWSPVLETWQTIEHVNPPLRKPVNKLGLARAPVVTRRIRVRAPSRRWLDERERIPATATQHDLLTSGFTPDGYPYARSEPCSLRGQSIKNRVGSWVGGYPTMWSVPYDERTEALKILTAIGLISEAAAAAGESKPRNGGPQGRRK